MTYKIRITYSDGSMEIIEKWANNEDELIRWIRKFILWESSNA